MSDDLDEFGLAGLERADAPATGSAPAPANEDEMVTLYARPDGCDVAGDGSKERPFLTAARAMRAAGRVIRQRTFIDISGTSYP